MHLLALLLIDHGFSISEVESLREIQALKRLNPHKHIVDLLLVLL